VSQGVGEHYPISCDCTDGDDDKKMICVIVAEKPKPNMGASFFSYSDRVKGWDPAHMLRAKSAWPPEQFPQ